MDNQNVNRVNLEKSYRAYAEGLAKLEASEQRSVTLRATAKLVKDAYMEGRTGRFTWKCDEPPERGGEDLAPSPLEHFLAGAVF